MIEIIEYFMEYFYIYHYLFVPWDDYNTVWVACGVIWYLNKLNSRYIISEKSYGSIFHSKD